MIETSKLKDDFDKSLSFSDDKIRDLSFAVKSFLLLKDYDAAYEYVKLLTDQTNDCISITSSALRLLSICDAVRESDEIKVDAEYIEELILELQNGINSTAPHWLYGGRSDYYLSNVAAIYSALQAATAIMDQDEARRQMVALRNYALKSFLQGGHLTSIAGNSFRLGDLPVCTVPFCIFCAEDRILIESMEEESKRFFESVEGIGFRADEKENRELTLLLAWYFAEKGDLEKGDLIRAKNLYIAANKLEPSEGKQAFCMILSAIVEQVLNKKENQSGELVVIHKPMGTSDPYYTSLHERFPRLPIENQDVIINAEVLPAFGEHTVKLEYSRNGQNPTETVMKKEHSASGSQYYSANIGGFEFRDRISYRITADASQKHTVSESFSYSTAKWFDYSEIIGAEYIQEHIAVYFARDKQSDIAPVLLIKPHGKAASLELSFDKALDIRKQLEFGDFGADGFDITVERRGIYVHEKDGREVILGLENNIVSILYTGEDIISMRLNLVSKQEEKYFGMGERYSSIEYRGLRVDNYVYNQYRDQGMKTYMPSPFFLSSTGYGLYLNTNAYSVFDFCCTNSDAVSIEGYCKNGSCELELYIGNPKEIVSSYIRKTGLPELPPIWAFGPWMSSNNWDSQKAVLLQLEMTKKHDIPATVLVIEQWSDEATFYIFNDAKFKLKDGKERFCASEFEFSQWGRWHSPKSMVNELHQEGIKVLLWQIPFHKYMGGVSHAQRDEDERVMIEDGYCVRNADGTPYRIPYGWFSGSLVLDFTNPEARQWWLGKRRYLLEDIGIDGFKTDGGECILGDGLQFFDGSSGREMHNRYVLDYIGAYNHYVKETKGEGITFSRAGYAGSQTMPLHWAGDERSTWDAFRSSIRAGISAGLSGILFWGWDLAGFHGEIPTVELFIRSAQMAAFCPVMQYHAETKGEFCRDRTPWNITDRTGDERAISLYRKYAKLRMNLLPYIYSEAIRSVQSNEPLMRAMIYDFPDEIESAKLDMQYMFGQSMLVAPVAEEGSIMNRVYIPQGNWYGLFDNVAYKQSGYYDIDSPLDRIPVFIKGNSIIPLNLDSSLELFSSVGNIVEHFRNLCFDIRLEDEISGSFDFGAAGQVKINVERIKNDIKVSTIAEQSIILRFWNEERPLRIFVDKQQCEEHEPIESRDALHWYSSKQQIIIKVRKGTHQIRIEA